MFAEIINQQEAIQRELLAIERSSEERGEARGEARGRKLEKTSNIVSAFEQLKDINIVSKIFSMSIADIEKILHTNGIMF